ncbi:MAG: hypothetical protein ABSH06_14995 [Thermodesulfobacteriota bacterium]
MSSELSDIQNLFKTFCKQPIYEFPKPREVLHAPDKQGAKRWLTLKLDRRFY